MTAQEKKGTARMWRMWAHISDGIPDVRRTRHAALASLSMDGEGEVIEVEVREILTNQGET